MTCRVDHTDKLPMSKISKLEESQAIGWRHKCAGCAYLLGQQDALETEARLRDRIRELTEEVRKLRQSP